MQRTVGGRGLQNKIGGAGLVTGVTDVACGLSGDLGIEGGVEGDFRLRKIVNGMAGNIEELFAIRQSRAEDVARVIEIWRGAVDATHDFLAAADRQEIDDAACAYLAGASLWVLVDEADRPMAFSALTGSNMDALFVAAEARGRGLGTRLVRHALSLSAELSTQVNEQNSHAMGFYLKLGFKPVGRDARDDSGRPYPIVHLAWDAQSRGGEPCDRP